MNLNKLAQLAKKEYKKIGVSHDWNHVKRVKENALKISEKEGGDKTILLPACLLHDLGRSKGKEKKHSSNVMLTVKILQNSGYNTGDVDEIVGCIKTHSFKNTPKSLEAKILFDADKLDSYGAVGVARFFMLAGEHNWSLRESADKAFERMAALDKVGGFYTTEGEKIGLSKAKIAFLLYYSFFQELNEHEKVKGLEKMLAHKLGPLKSKFMLKTLKVLL